LTFPKREHSPPKSRLPQLHPHQLWLHGESSDFFLPSLQARQALGLVEESLDLSLLATPDDIRRTRKELGEPDPWTLSCHKIFLQKPKNRHFEGRFFGVLRAPQKPQIAPDA
jgi:hypothetical protein